MSLEDENNALRARIAELEAEVTEQSQNERFRLVVESAPNGILVVNKEGRIILVNHQAEILFGYTREEFEGLRIESLVPSRYREGHVKTRAQFHQAPERRGMGLGRDLHAVRKDGQEFPVEIALTPLPSEAGTHVLASIIDITERKRSEERLQRYSEELERSNAELESFASVASHDLQEPLRKIRTMGERLQQVSGEELGEKGRDYLERMVKAGDNMHRLIRDLLAFSRVATRAQPFQRIDLGGALQEAVSNLEIAIEDAGAEILSGDLPEIDADEGQMIQLFQNLVGNAVKFRHPEVPPRVQIDASIEGEGKSSMLVLRIADNGIGFEEKYQERIFSIFQRLHGKGKFEGTGIGLAICKKIVERHGGTITATSAPNEGSVFVIRLPVVQNQEPPAEEL